MSNKYADSDSDDYSESIEFSIDSDYDDEPPMMPQQPNIDPNQVNQIVMSVLNGIFGNGNWQTSVNPGNNGGMQNIQGLPPGIQEMLKGICGGNQGNVPGNNNPFNNGNFAGSNKGYGPGNSYGNGHSHSHGHGNVPGQGNPFQNMTINNFGNPTVPEVNRYGIPLNYGLNTKDDSTDKDSGKKKKRRIWSIDETDPTNYPLPHIEYNPFFQMHTAGPKKPRDPKEVDELFDKFFNYIEAKYKTPDCLNYRLPGTYVL